MKVLSKATVLKLKQLEHTLNEKTLMACISCPFTVNLLDTFKDNTYVYMALEVRVCVPCCISITRVAVL